MNSQKIDPQIKIQDNNEPTIEMNQQQQSVSNKIKYEEQDVMVKKQEESQNFIIYYQTQNKLICQEQTKHQQKISSITKNNKHDYIQQKTKIIKKSTPTNTNPNKKCKDRRTGKYQQSLAQRFVKKITGYHYCKNFNQFLYKQLFIFLKSKKSETQFQIQSTCIYDFKAKYNNQISKQQIIEFIDFILQNVKHYQPFMKKYKQRLIFQLFLPYELNFFYYFYRHLIRKLYEIMIKASYRKVLRQMLKTRKQSVQIDCLSYNGLDQIGQIQIKSAFDVAFQLSVSQYQIKILQNKQLIKLKLQKLTEIQ